MISDPYVCLGRIFIHILKASLATETLCVSDPYFSAHCSVFVKVGWNNNQVWAELLRDEARHGGTDPKLPCMVVGSCLRRVDIT